MRAEADDAERLAADLAAVRRARSRGQRPAATVGGRPVGAAQQQHRGRDHVFGDRVRVRAGGGDDGDAARRAAVDVDVVEADAEPADDLQRVARRAARRAPACGCARSARRRRGAARGRRAGVVDQRRRRRRTSCAAARRRRPRSSMNSVMTMRDIAARAALPRSRRRLTAAGDGPLRRSRTGASARTRDGRAPRPRSAGRWRCATCMSSSWSPAWSRLISRCSRPEVSTSTCSLISAHGARVGADLDHRQDRVADHVALPGREEVHRVARRRAQRHHLGRRARRVHEPQARDGSASRPCRARRRRCTSCRSSGCCRAPSPRSSSGRRRCCPWSAASRRGRCVLWRLITSW